MDFIELLLTYIEPLQKALDVFLSKIDSPEFIKEEKWHGYRYNRPSPRIFQILKCVRIVSGFNAGVHLLSKGFVQEVGVLNRTIFEFLHDIDFIQAGIDTGKFTQSQKEMLDSFFAGEIRSAKDLMDTHKKQPGVSRKKVYAELGRLLKPDDPDRIQRIVKTLEEAYSGYIHGQYPHIMELYNGYTRTFHTKGMLGTPRIPEHTGELARTLHQALNQFAAIASSWDLQDFAEKLVNARISLETSGVYSLT